MRSTRQYIGECISCGDELYLFKTKQHKRLVKCINEGCPDHFLYPIPKKGKVEITGIICPKNNLPLLAIIPSQYIAKGKFRNQEKKTYFWSDSPCFSCSKRSKCLQYKEAIIDYN